MKSENQVKEELDRIERIYEQHNDSGVGGLITGALLRSRRDTLRWVLQLQSLSTKARSE